MYYVLETGLVNYNTVITNNMHNLKIISFFELTVYIEIVREDC